MISMKKSNKYGSFPSIRKLFPPKNCDRRIDSNQDRHSVQLLNRSCFIPSFLLLGVTQNSSQHIDSILSLDHVISIHANADESSSSSATLHQSDAQSTPSSEAPPSSFQTSRDGTPINLKTYVPLYRAALKGDWAEGKGFLDSYPGAVRARITKGRETALHIAAGARRTEFVEELVKRMNAKDLAIQNNDDNTALCFAAASGITRIAELMVKKNDKLPGIRGSAGVMPLHMAAVLGHREMVWYLFFVTNEEDLTVDDYFGILVATINSDLYDVALHILLQKRELATYCGQNGETALHVLARRPSAFHSGTQLGIWERCIYPWIHIEPPNSAWPFDNSKYWCPGIGIIHVPQFKAVREKKLQNVLALELAKCLWEEVASLNESEFGDLLGSHSQPLFTAAEHGIVELVAELVKSYPDLIWKVDSENRSLFHIAVMHRQEKIFSLIYDIGAHKDLITSYTDRANRNILHIAGKLASSNQLKDASGAALQMHRELLWFKEVEKLVQPLYKEMKDSEGRTPRMLFTEEHKGLLQEGEKWMKNTASSCMLVATLITTVMFAAVFTVPGGNNNETGVPIFLRSKSFKVFALSDALALFSSVTSVLMFLSILTSRYAEEDFLTSLPKRLSIGIATLFFSIITMLIAFGATFFIVLGHEVAWVVIPVGIIACIPVILFAFLQFPILADMMRCTLGQGWLAQNHKYTIY